MSNRKISIIIKILHTVVLFYREPIVASVSWATDDVAVVVWMNRVQNKAAIVAYDTATNTSTVVSILTTN